MRAVCAPSIAPQTVKFLHKRHGRAHEEDLCRVNNRFRGPWVKCQLATSELRAGLHGTEGLQGRLANACKDGRLDKALEALLQMEKQGFVPAVQTYCNLLQICVEKRAVAEVRQVRAHVAKNGLESHLFLGESLVNALVKCGSLADALEIFCRLPQRTVFSWTAVMTGYMQGGQAREALRLFGQMQAACVQPNKYTFVTLLRACGSLADLEEGQRIHAEAVKHRCEQDLFVATTLMDMYARCGSMTNARLVFDRLPRPDVASWTAIIAGYVLSEQGEVAFDMYEKMQEEGVRPNDRTLVRVLQACCILEDSEEHSLEEGATVRARMLQRGRAIHAQAAWMRCESDIFVGSILVHMYVTSGSLLDAMHVFERLSQRDVVTWSAMIAGYAQFAEGEKALQLYRLMQEEGVRPNGRTFVSALQACGSLAEMQGEGPHIKASALCKGKAIHAEAAWSRDEADVFVGSALVHMYARCGSILDAQHVFDALPERDVVAWTAMISACAEQGAGEQALQTYSQMQAAGVPPNETTFLCILKACSDIGALNICHEVYHHTQAHQGSKKWTLVGNALIHAYGKCGSMVHSEQVFNWMPRQDVYAWTAVIAGYARQGNSEASLHFFQKMQLAGVKPNGVTFLSLLSACSHSGLIDRALGYFQSMTSNHGIQATIQHYAIIIDSLCRVGLLSKAQDLLQEMPQQPDLAIWSSVLAACRQHGNLELGRRAFDSLVLLAPHDGAAYVVMSNIYADAGMWDLSLEIDELRRNAGAWKQPGQSWIEHEDEVHMFMSEDQRHDQSNQIYNSLNDFHSQQTEGYTRASVAHHKDFRWTTSGDSSGTTSPGLGGMHHHLDTAIFLFVEDLVHPLHLAQVGLVRDDDGGIQVAILHHLVQSRPVPLHGSLPSFHSLVLLHEPSQVVVVGVARVHADDRQPTPLPHRVHHLVHHLRRVGLHAHGDLRLVHERLRVMQPHRLDPHIRPVRQLPADRVIHILLLEIDALHKRQLLLGVVQPVLHLVDEEHLRRPAHIGAVRRENPHRAAPPDGHRVAAAHLRELVGVPRRGQNVRQQNDLLVGEAVGHLEQIHVGDGHAHELRLPALPPARQVRVAEEARGAVAVELLLLFAVVGAVAAGEELQVAAEEALPAGDVEAGHGAVAPLHVPHLRPDLLHDAHELVAHHVPALHPRHSAHVQVQVGAADAGAGHPEDHVLGVRDHRHRPLLVQLHVPLAVPFRCSHVSGAVHLGLDGHDGRQRSSSSMMMAMASSSRHFRCFTCFASLDRLLACCNLETFKLRRRRFPHK